LVSFEDFIVAVLAVRCAAVILGHHDRWSCCLSIIRLPTIARFFDMCLSLKTSIISPWVCSSAFFCARSLFVYYCRASCDLIDFPWHPDFRSIFLGAIMLVPSAAKMDFMDFFSPDNRAAFPRFLFYRAWSMLRFCFSWPDCARTSHLVLAR